LEDSQNQRNKKKARLENRKIYYVDEAALKLLPSIQKTYSRIGVRPIVETKHKYRVYSIAGAIAEDGDLFYELRTDSYDGDKIVKFIKALLEHAESKILIIWDGATCHINDEVKTFLANQEDQAVWLEKIPSYCPELNASEQVWNYLKNVELKNVCCKTAKELKEKAINKLERIKEKTELIKSFFRHSDVAFY